MQYPSAVFSTPATPATLSQTDPQLAALLTEEESRQRFKIRLIASENFASSAVREACSSVITNQYSEGYAGARYYEGQQFVDQVERLAIERAKTLFGAEHVNVQPHSGSPANLAVYLAFLKPGDVVELEVEGIGILRSRIVKPSATVAAAG